MYEGSLDLQILKNMGMKKTYTYVAKNTKHAHIVVLHDMVYDKNNNNLGVVVQSRIYIIERTLDYAHKS